MGLKALFTSASNEICSVIGHLQGNASGDPFSPGVRSNHVDPGKTCSGRVYTRGVSAWLCHMQVDRGTSLLPEELWQYTLSTAKAVLEAVRFLQNRSPNCSSLIKLVTDFPWPLYTGPYLQVRVLQAYSGVLFGLFHCKLCLVT
jgi:hypothetical protein